MQTVLVAGLGYVGLPTAALLARAGYAVKGVDVDEALVSELRSGQCRLEEPDVNALVETVLANGTLSASLEPSEADVFIVCVPTPVRRDGTANVDMVRAAARAIAPHVKRGDLLILESTSPIGTTERVIGAALRDVGLDPRADVDVCYCPERVFPGDTIREIVENDRIIGGLTDRAAERARDFYASFCRGEPVLTTAETAEFSKLMENTYRDVNIALANAFARIAEETSADVREVIRLANMHPRVNVHMPGAGVGGHCIPVDPKFLIEAFPEHTKLLEQAREINDTQAIRMIDRAEAAGLQRGSRVAILGAAYRADIDDARDTPTEILIQDLSRRGYEWRTHDPLVVDFQPQTPGLDPNLSSDLDFVLDGASAAFVMTGHSSYRSLGPGLFSRVMDGAMIVDGPAVLEGEPLSASRLRYLRVGRAS
ncbi:MAG: nucleotide sugar dehydrogenase [Litorimonas sp.]